MIIDGVSLHREVSIQPFSIGRLEVCDILNATLLAVCSYNFWQRSSSGYKADHKIQPSTTRSCARAIIATTFDWWTAIQTYNFSTASVCSSRYKPDFSSMERLSSYLSFVNQHYVRPYHASIHFRSICPANCYYGMASSHAIHRWSRCQRYAFTALRMVPGVEIRCS